MWSDITKCGLRSPKVAFSGVIFHFIFTDILYLQCRMLQNEKVVSFSVIHNPKRHFLNFMPASRAFLFMRLNWLASEKPHSWYLCPLEICGQRHPCQHYSPSSWNSHGSWWPDQVHWSSLEVFFCAMIWYLISQVLLLSNRVGFDIFSQICSNLLQFLGLCGNRKWKNDYAMRGMDMNN